MTTLASFESRFPNRTEPSSKFANFASGSLSRTQPSHNPNGVSLWSGREFVENGVRNTSHGSHGVSLFSGRAVIERRKPLRTFAILRRCLSQRKREPPGRQFRDSVVSVAGTTLRSSTLENAGNHPDVITRKRREFVIATKDLRVGA